MKYLGQEEQQAKQQQRRVQYMCGGYNESGQTGRKGKQWQLRIPRQLPPQLFGCPAATGPNSRWFDIACGREHTAAVASDGSLFTWGIIYISSLHCIPFYVCSLLIMMR